MHTDGGLACELIAGIRRAPRDMGHAAEVIEKYIVRFATIPHEALLMLMVDNTEQVEKKLSVRMDSTQFLPTTTGSCELISRLAPFSNNDHSRSRHR